MDKAVLQICKTLQGKGHRCLLVGGAVRDILMGREPKDFDLVTDADPAEVEKLFKKTISVGKQFGVIVVIEEGKQYEVATFRSEHGYSDARHPDTVTWTTPEQDAERRDFTINALFFDPLTDKVKDYVNGKADLEAKLVRFIGDPAARIIEDHLRLLRAVRLKSELAFEYEPATWQAIVEHASEIATASAQRIRDELNKILLTPHRVEALEDLDKSGLLKVILPELEALHGINQEWKFHGKGDVLTHTLLAVKVLPHDSKLEVVWGTLLHDIGKPATKATVPDKKFGGTRTGFYGHHEVGAKIAEELLRRLRFPNDQIELVVWLVRHHMMIHEILEMRVGRQKRWLLDPRLPDLLELHRADASGKGEGKRINLQAYQEVKKLMQDERAKPPPPPKLVDGNDVMKEFKLKPGPKVGELLKLVEDAVWEGQIKTRQAALMFVKKYITQPSQSVVDEFAISGHLTIRDRISRAADFLVKNYQDFSLATNFFGYIIDELGANIEEHAQAKTVRIAIEPIDQGFRVIIQDDGIGIGRSLTKQYPKLSANEAIEKALQGYSSKGNGRGYGLRTSKKLVELVGGHFQVASGSKGTQIMLHFPSQLALPEDVFYEVISGKL